MKNLGFNSPYAVVGMFFAVVALGFSTFYDFRISSAHSAPLAVYDAGDVRGARPEFNFDFDPQHKDLREFVDERNRADVPNFRDAGDDAFYSGSETPCFRVEIDPKVAGHDQDYRLDMFGGTHIETTDLFRSGLEDALAESFKDEAWARDRKCFNGSFVVSFDVDGTGRLGSNMLVHHLRGSSSTAGLAVLDVLRGMDIDGHQWHDGSLAGGEVRVPVSFRLE
jgi:hypothetical protein